MDCSRELECDLRDSKDCGGGRSRFHDVEIRVIFGTLERQVSFLKWSKSATYHMSTIGEGKERQNLCDFLILKNLPIKVFNTGSNLTR